MGSLGEQLKQARDDAGLSLGDLSERTKIQVKYLERLENEEFDKLPKLVYVRGFIQKWASACQIESENLILQFYRENQPILNKSKKDEALSSVSSPSFIITSGHIISTLVFIAIAGLLGYFYYNQQLLSEAPEIEITSPMEVSSAVEEEVVVIKGELENIKEISINGYNVPVEGKASFEYPYRLQAGLNTVFIKAKAHNGKEVETVRKILKIGDEEAHEVNIEEEAGE